MAREGGNPLLEQYRFKPGHTGNPNGRPPKLKIPPLDEVLGNVLSAMVGASAKTQAEALLDKLMELALKGDTRAAEILLDRGYGKPKQSIDVAGEITHAPQLLITLPQGLNIKLPSNTEGIDEAEVVSSQTNDD